MTERRTPDIVSRVSPLAPTSASENGPLTTCFESFILKKSIYTTVSNFIFFKLYKATFTVYKNITKMYFFNLFRKYC